MAAGVFMVAFGARGSAPAKAAAVIGDTVTADAVTTKTGTTTTA